MSFASLPIIPSLYETAEVCSTESEATKSVSGDFKASPKVESVSDYITASVCESELPSPFATPEVCPTEVSTEYDDAECRCKPEKVAVSEGIQVAVPEPVEPVVTQPVEQEVPAPGEDVVHAVSLDFCFSPRGPLTISSPTIISTDIESTPSTTTIARNISLPDSVAISSVAPSKLPEPSARSTRSVPPPLPGPSSIASPRSLASTPLLSSVTESTPTSLTLSHQPSSPIIRDLRAAETDDSYESSILRAFPSVQSIAFPEGPDISFDMSFLWPICISLYAISVPFSYDPLAWLASLHRRQRITHQPRPLPRSIARRMASRELNASVIPRLALGPFSDYI